MATPKPVGNREEMAVIVNDPQSVHRFHMAFPAVSKPCPVTAAGPNGIIHSFDALLLALTRNNK
jgi:hypothetical protein